MLEPPVAHLVGPDGRADRLAHLQDRPDLRVARVAPVAVHERRLETRVGAPLLDGEAAQVAHRRPSVVASEVDDAHHPGIDEPVPRLPVAVGGDDHHGPGRVLGQQRSHPIRLRRVHAVRAVQGRQRLRRRGTLELRVEPSGLCVQDAQQPAGLPVDLRVVLGGRALDELARQVPGDEHPALAVGVQQPGRVARGGQHGDGVLVCGDLPQQVVARASRRLHHELTRAVRHPQDRRVELVPRHVAQQPDGTEPLTDAGDLLRGEPSAVPRCSVAAHEDTVAHPLPKYLRPWKVLL